LMEGSQWHRYPSSPYFNIWLEAKLSHPDSLGQISFQPSTPSSPAATAPQSPFQGADEVIIDLKEHIRSHLKGKPLHIFLSDPLGYRSFKGYLEYSKIGFEYSEYLSMWLAIEAFKKSPSTASGTEIFIKYFGTTSDSGLIVVPDIMLNQISEGLKAPVISKDIFQSAQAHIFNRLKKEAFTKTFFASINFTDYLDQLVSLDCLLDSNDHKIISQYELGSPSDKGLDQNGYTIVAAKMMEFVYQAKFKSKASFVKWSHTNFQKYSVHGFLTLSQFMELYHVILRDPKIPFFKIDCQD